MSDDYKERYKELRKLVRRWVRARFVYDFINIRQLSAELDLEAVEFKMMELTTGEDKPENAALAAGSLPALKLAAKEPGFFFGAKTEKVQDILKEARRKRGKR